MNHPNNNRFLRFFTRNKNVVPKIRNFFTFMGIIFIIIVILELSLSPSSLHDIHLEGESGGDVYEHRYDPYTGFSTTLRDTKNNCAYDDSIQIHIYGGSTTWGDRVEYDKTYPSFISEILCDKNVNVNVTNYGQLAYTNTQSIIKFILNLKRDNVPNIVIFYDGVNEIPAEPGLPMEKMTEDVVEYAFSQSTLFSAKRQLFSVFGGNRINSMRILDNYFEKFQRHHRDYDDDTSRYLEILNNYFENLRLIKSLENEYGFTSIFYWQPNLATKEELSTKEKQFLFDDDLTGWLDEYFAFYNATAEKIETTKKIIDLTDLFDDHPGTIYLDDCHKNEEGNRILAERMVEDILKTIDDG